MVVARYLAEEGIPVTVFEAADELQKDLRASTFHPPTLEMLERFGATEFCIAQGLICPLWQFRDRYQGEVATFDLSILSDDTRHPYRVQCEQWRLAEYLCASLDAFPHATVRFGCKAKEVVQSDSGVELTIETEGGEEETIAGRFLVGADGAGSAIRKSIGVEFEGMTFPETFLTLSTTFDFQQAIPDLADIGYFADPTEWLVLLRTRSVWRVLFPTSDESDEAMTQPTRVQQRLQEVISKDSPYEVVHTTAYRVHERVAQKYVVGRVMLAGDAAHINNPLGGMGMNGSIHDAMNLSDKITRMWKDPAISVESLGRYERQRRKVAIDTVQAQAKRNRDILNETDPVKRQAYYDDLRRIVDDKQRHRDYLLRSSMIQSLRDLEQVH